MLDEKIFARGAFGDQVPCDKLETYFKLYRQRRDNYTRYCARTRLQDRPTQDDLPETLLKLLRAIKGDCAKNKHEICRPIFSSAPRRNTMDQKEQDHLCQAVAQLLVMVDIGGPPPFENGEATRWRSNETFAQFMQRILPYAMHENNSVVAARKDASRLKAWKLAARANITFKPTDSLASHLLFDPSRRVILIFHHTAFLEALLACSDDQGQEQHDVGWNMKNGVNLPRQLVLETLMTIQGLLFPFADKKNKSHKFLKKLVYIDEPHFEPECLRIASEVAIALEAGDFQYHYFGERLVTLHKLALNPPPKNAFMKWLQRHTSERNALYVAILGLFLSAFFGLLGVILGVIQCVIAYRQLQQGSNTT